MMIKKERMEYDDKERKHEENERERKNGAWW